MTSSATTPTTTPTDVVAPPARVAILISGRGSNLGAILAAREQLAADIVLVASSHAEAAGLAIAREQGVATTVLASGSRAERDASLLDVLSAHDVSWVVLAGFMRILGDEVLSRFERRMVNIHPSLLPAFPGLHPHRQALDAGVRVTGCTVHFVAAGDVDGGAIVAQAVVPVLPGDDEAALAERVLAAEHRLYPAALRALFGGHVTWRDDRVVLDAHAANLLLSVSGLGPDGAGA